jgi:hypothetical protein
MTDYTGVSLDDIISHLRDWQQMTRDTTAALASLREQVDKQRDVLDYPHAAFDHIDYCCDLFERYTSDFDRLLHELPRGVRSAHLEIIQQIFRSSAIGDQECVRFKQDFIERRNPTQKARPLLEQVYSESRSAFIDYRDLSNVLPRLRTYVTQSHDGDVVRLAPTLWGVGIDLKVLWRRVSGRWRRTT